MCFCVPERSCQELVAQEFFTAALVHGVGFCGAVCGLQFISFSVAFGVGA